MRIGAVTALSRHADMIKLFIVGRQSVLMKNGDHEAVIKMILKGRSPHMIRVLRSH